MKSRSVHEISLSDESDAGRWDKMIVNSYHEPQDSRGKTYKHWLNALEPVSDRYQYHAKSAGLATN